MITLAGRPGLDGCEPGAAIVVVGEVCVMRTTGGLKLATVVFAAAVSLAGSAMAGRGIQVDDPNTPPLAFTPCTLGGSGCVGIAASSPEFVGAFSGDGSTTLYIYQEGVVSFGAELPTTASLAGGPASFGLGNWFAPSFGAATTVEAFHDPEGPGQFRINWGPSGLPVFQLFILDDTFNGVAEIGLNGDVQPGSLIAYNYTPFNWVPPPGFIPGGVDPTVDAIPLNVPGSFGLGPTSVTPEPASWALMIAGFGLMGAMLRRRRRAMAPAV
jgi:hypothetical protein